MNYCSLKDAWSNNDHISKQFKEYMNPYLLEKNVENFANEEANIIKRTKEERVCTNIDCDDIKINDNIDNNDNINNNNDDVKINNNIDIDIHKFIFELRNRLRENDYKVRQLEEKVKLQENIISQLKNSNNIVNNNSTTNITNNITNIDKNIVIQITNYGDENYENFNDDDYRQILDAGFNCVLESFRLTHLNVKIPEQQNFKITNLKSQYCSIYINNNWQTVLLAEKIKEILYNHIRHIKDVFSKKSDLVSNYSKRKIISFLEDFNKLHKYRINEDSFGSAYNNKMKTDIIKSILHMEARLIKDLTLMTYNYFKYGSSYEY
jgi:hypothetical protein